MDPTVKTPDRETKFKKKKKEKKRKKKRKRKRNEASIVTDSKYLKAIIEKILTSF